MATIKVKVLLINLRDYIIEEEGFCGMCVSNASMFDNKKIDGEEFVYVHNYIYEKKSPKNYFKGYWWKVGNKKPRINWLNRQIEKLD